MRIVAVDDSEVLLELVSEILEGDGHIVHRAETAVAALDAMAAHPVDLVLSEVNMAAMSGFEFAQVLRGNPDYASIPIIFVTGDESENFKTKSCSVGANGWLKKPFKPAQILGMVRSFEL